jgi:uncharacterized membrane protein
MLGFSLARLQYLNVAGDASTSYKNGARPGEWYIMREGHYRVGITLHLATVIPGGILSVFQFVPIIRKKLILFHRINGYLIIILFLLGNVGALMIARRAFGGGFATQSAVGLLALTTTLSLFLAYYNIKRLQIDQHRVWMLRAMFLFGTIITTRIIMIIAALIITKLGDFYELVPCAEIAFARSVGTADAAFLQDYPVCRIAAYTAVTASMSGTPGVETVGAALALPFGAALWMSIFLHLVGLEIYLQLTPREAQRLRQLSYEKQLARGFKHPGSAGLTSDRWGDADPWVPLTPEKKVEEAGAPSMISSDSAAS